MSFSLPNLFTFNQIENNLYRILKKHKLSFAKDKDREFVSMIQVEYGIFFEIYEDNTYITFKSKMSHLKFDNKHPNDIYDAAEMIGLLLGGY